MRRSLVDVVREEGQSRKKMIQVEVMVGQMMRRQQERRPARQGRDVCLIPSSLSHETSDIEVYVNKG